MALIELSEIDTRKFEGVMQDFIGSVILYNDTWDLLKSGKFDEAI